VKIIPPAGGLGPRTSLVEEQAVAAKRAAVAATRVRLVSRYILISPGVVVRRRL
jgi:hypothetical protein